MQIATIEIQRPKTVVIRASPIPAVTISGSSSLLLKLLKELIMPVMVPKRPRTGASATITFR